MPDQLNTAPYDNVASSLTGGRSHKRSGKRGTTSCIAAFYEKTQPWPHWQYQQRHDDQT